jgi:TRAP-type uncharacterized transport system fused permease subunit
VIIASASLAIAALAAGLQGWLVVRTNAVERALLIVGGPARSSCPQLDYVGSGSLLLGLVLQSRAARPPA